MAKRKTETEAPEQKRRAKVAKAMREKLQGLEGATGGDNPFMAMQSSAVLRMIAVTGTEQSWRYSDLRQWAERADTGDYQYLHLLWQNVCPVLVERLNFGAIVDCDPAYEEALEIGRRLWDMCPAAVDELAE